MIDDQNNHGTHEQPEIAYADLPPGKRILRIARAFFYVARVVWVLLAVVVLVLTLIYHGPAYKDATEAETLLMLALSFPSGWLVVLLLVGMVGGWRHLFGSEVPELLFAVFSWVLWTAIGYVQWFVFVPWGARKLANLADRFFRKEPQS